MWVRIRAVIIEDEPLAAEYLAALLDDTCRVEVVGTAPEGEAGLRLCAELRPPDAVFLDIRLPGGDGVALATQLAMLPQPPRVVFTTGHAERAPEAWRDPVTRRKGAPSCEKDRCARPLHQKWPRI